MLGTSVQRQVLAAQEGKFLLYSNQSAFDRGTDNPSGWCGNTTAYCSRSARCQSTYGTCDTGGTGNTGNVQTGTSTNGQCGPNFGTCDSDQCCSLAGFCGTTSGTISQIQNEYINAYAQQTSVQLQTVRPILARLVTPTKHPPEPTHPQFQELSWAVSCMGLAEYLIVLCLVQWHSHMMMGHLYLRTSYLICLQSTMPRLLSSSLEIIMVRKLFLNSKIMANINTGKGAIDYTSLPWAQMVK